MGVFSERLFCIFHLIGLLKLEPGGWGTLSLLRNSIESKARLI